MSAPLNASRPTRSAWIGVAGALVAGSLSWTCRPPATNDQTGANFDHSALLRSIVEQVILPAHTRAELCATDLVSAVRLYRLANDGEPRKSARKVAQNAWRQMMWAWQAEEMLQLGPAGSEATMLGGEGLRDEIYSWPTTNGCRIDQEIVKQGYENDDFTEVNLINVYGMDALEYLLFNESPENSCAETIPINTEDSWDALGVIALEERRANYALQVSEQLQRTVRALHSTWVESFADQLMHTGDGSVYPTDHDALNDLFSAVFYLDLQTKDKKMTAPLESPWAEHSGENICANLLTMQHIYWGGPSAEEGIGLDDSLNGIGEHDLALEVDQAIVIARETCDDMSFPLVERLSDAPSQVKDLHDDIKTITDLLKTSVVLALSLDLPSDGAGDAD